MNGAGLPYEHLDCSDNRPALQPAIWLLAGRCQKVLNAMDFGDSLSCSVHDRASNLRRAWLAIHNLSSADWGVLRRSISGWKDLRVAKESVGGGVRTRLSGARNTAQQRLHRRCSSLSSSSATSNACFETLSRPPLALALFLRWKIATALSSLSEFLAASANARTATVRHLGLCRCKHADADREQQN